MISDRTRMTAIVMVLLCVLVSAQAVASVTASTEGRSATGQVLGKTGFAFIGGLRTFAAAVLWNRLDPIHDGYYQEKSVAEQTFMLPSLRLITILDPQFVHAYYYAAYAVASTGDQEGGIAVAREGVAQNPESGLMRANLVQMLMMEDKTKNLPEMVRLSKEGIAKGMRYDSTDDAFESFVIFRTAFTLDGDDELAARLEEASAELAASGDVTADHDHDHDGVQDH